MSSREWPFKLTDVRRLVQAAENCRLKVYGLRFTPDGTIIVDTQPTAALAAKPVDNGVVNGRPNSFDQVLGK